MFLKTSYIDDNSYLFLLDLFFSCPSFHFVRLMLVRNYHTNSGIIREARDEFSLHVCFYGEIVSRNVTRN